MSTALREASENSGQPIRCYEFQRGPLRWMYTSGDRDYELDNKTFRAGYQIADSGIEVSGQSSADQLTITLAGDADISTMFRVLAPSDPIELVIWDTHFGETDRFVAWMGTIQNVKWPTLGTCEISLSSIAASLNRPGLTIGWQRGCPYSLYDRNCRVNSADYRVTGQISLSSGITAVMNGAASFPDQWFAGGYMEWDIGSGVLEKRGIRQHIGDTLLLLGGVFGLAPGQRVSIYPGCYRTTSVCNIKFSNMVNYGGHPHLPGRSPFDGNPIF